ncbi:MAG: hypothetical protein IBX36_04525 [Dehalococcoidia bacterium]|nr:hypothetical protein [Dehalococcoidia bacterium]
MERTIKIVVFGALLAGAGCFLGLVLRWVGEGYEVLIPPSWDALYLGIWLLGAVVAVAVTGGLVAVLLRPFWVAAIAFAVSALAMFLTWEISAVSGIAAAVYFLVGLLYLAGVRGEIGNRIRFSVWHIRGSQMPLLVGLVAIACASLYSGYAAEIEREGFSIPEDAIDWVVEIADEQLDSLVPEGTLSPEEKQEVLDQLRATLEGEVGSAIEPYESYIPIGLAAIVFMILTPVTFLISWIPLLILSPLIFILTRSGVVRKVTETVEVTRLSIE